MRRLIGATGLVCRIVPIGIEALSKLWHDDRNTVSAQRAGNVIHWLNQPGDLLQRWVRLMTPHLQTNALKGLMNDSRLIPVKDVMQAELQRRGC